MTLSCRTAATPAAVAATVAATAADDPLSCDCTQSIIVSNSTFVDCSGGGVKLGSSGERGAPAPNVSLPVEKQDRGFLLSDNLLKGIPAEYSSANPFFAG